MFSSFEVVRKDINNKFIKAFGVRVRELRLGKGMSMHQLANQCDIEYSQISRIERGLINTSLNTISVLAIALDVEYCELLKFERVSSSE